MQTSKLPTTCIAVRLTPPCAWRLRPALGCRRMCGARIGFLCPLEAPRFTPMRGGTLVSKATASFRSRRASKRVSQGGARSGRPCFYPPLLGSASTDSTCALELARCVASNGVTVHAGFAHVNTLTELPCIEIFISLGDASTLLIGVLSLLGTAREAECYCRQNTEASHVHGESLRFRPLGAASN
jgi:hypothetical protein